MSQLLNHCQPFDRCKRAIFKSSQTGIRVDVSPIRECNSNDGLNTPKTI